MSETRRHVLGAPLCPRPALLRRAAPRRAAPRRAALRSPRLALPRCAPPRLISARRAPPRLAPPRPALPCFAPHHNAPPRRAAPCPAPPMGCLGFGFDNVPSSKQVCPCWMCGCRVVIQCFFALAMNFGTGVFHNFGTTKFARPPGNKSLQGVINHRGTAEGLARHPGGFCK